MPTCEKKVFKNAKKVVEFFHGSDNFLVMQANSIITDDFNTQIQSDEFASEWEQIKLSSEFVSEFETYLDEMEKKYWQDISNRGN